MAFLHNREAESPEIAQFHIRLKECISAELHVTSHPESLSGSTLYSSQRGKSNSPYLEPPGCSKVLYALFMRRP